MGDRCMFCLKPLGTADVNGVCQACAPKAKKPTIMTPLEQFEWFRQGGYKPCDIPSSSALWDAENALRAQQERVNSKPMTLMFGDGKIAVSTCYPEGTDESQTDALVLWNPNTQQGIGEHVEIPNGTTTDDIEMYVRLIFKNAESAQVVVDALNRIIAAYSKEAQ